MEYQSYSKLEMDTFMFLASQPLLLYHKQILHIMKTNNQMPSIQKYFQDHSYPNLSGAYLKTKAVVLVKMKSSEISVSQMYAGILLDYNIHLFVDSAIITTWRSFYMHQG